MAEFKQKVIDFRQNLAKREEIWASNILGDMNFREFACKSSPGLGAEHAAPKIYEKILEGKLVRVSSYQEYLKFILPKIFPALINSCLIYVLPKFCSV